MNTDKIKETIRKKDISEATRDKALAEIDVIVAEGKIHFDPCAYYLACAFWWDRTPSGIVFWEAISKAPDKPSVLPGKIRTFDSGATRNDDDNRLDYEGFLSPYVLKRYAQYMHKHRKQDDGILRASDNWQRGMSQDVYMESICRHFMDVWFRHRRKDVSEEALCALLFNVMGYLYEELK